uniref:Uncharacterized protein n=1 Tax=Acrobeloides nanus TaxID=290746 RepID=A0A914E2F8_9BILA
MVANGTFVCGIPPTTTTTTTSTITTTTIPCPIGGTWSAWGSASCSDTCGLCGSSVQSRTCLSQSSGCPCSGLTTQSIGYCAPIVCTFPRAACCSYATRQVVNNTFQCVQTSG